MPRYVLKLFLLLIFSNLSNAQISNFYRMDPKYKDKVSNTGLLGEYHSESLGVCSSMCGGRFPFFGFNAKQKNCRLHQYPPTEMDANENGWLYYISTDPDFDEITDCKRTIFGWEYRGNINLTKSGRVCQNWASQSPHSHTIGADQSENYCRNPDNEPTPWCYTTDPNIRLELCDIPMCVTPPLECLTNQDPTGISYFGKQNVSKTGYICQRWDSQTPHAHWYPHLADQDNYCQNPDGEGAPWCYTVNPNIRWSKCIIPHC